MTAKYSVLIPVFKTDPALLKRCLNSILQEKRDDVEIVLVEALSNGGGKRFSKARLRNEDPCPLFYFR
jgi:cellulose synthase/poly-beta-1,6-N-acetylglucosamine synthase-like glycosyltransferase